MWNKIELKNWQKHSNLEIQLTNGVNVIYGGSGVGKSCIRRAFQWIFENKKMDGIRKTGTKQTSVKIYRNDGVTIERVRSASINRFILNVPDQKEQVFDSIGKTIPDEIKTYLQITPLEIDGKDIFLNVSEQLTLPFLFDLSPSIRMKLFNKLTGNDVLDKLFSEFNKDVLQLGRNLKSEEESYEKRQTQIEEKEKDLKKIEIKEAKVLKLYKSISKNHEKYSKLLKNIELLTKNKCNLDAIKDKLCNLKVPQCIDFKELIEKIGKLEKVKNSLNALEYNEIKLDKISIALKRVCPTELDYGQIMGKIERLNKINSTIDSFDKVDTSLGMAKTKLVNIVKKQTELKEEYITLLKEAKVCPICENELSEECLEKIKL